MSCAESEKFIFLYKELDPSEKRTLDAHLATCDSCANIFEQTQQQRSVVQQVLKYVPDKLENQNPFLTAKIIAAIQSRKPESVVAKFLPFVRFSLVRYSMALVSITLLVVFLVEMRPAQKFAGVVEQYRQMPIAKTVRLNSQTFHEQIRDAIKRNSRTATSSFSIAACFNECKANEYKIACEECISQLNKLRNEGI
jgi:hypothetical protein